MAAQHGWWTRLWSGLAVAVVLVCFAAACRHEQIGQGASPRIVPPMVRVRSVSPLSMPLSLRSRAVVSFASGVTPQTIATDGRALVFSTRVDPGPVYEPNALWFLPSPTAQPRLVSRTSPATSFVESLVSAGEVLWTERSKSNRPCVDPDGECFTWSLKRRTMSHGLVHVITTSSESTGGLFLPHLMSAPGGPIALMPEPGARSMRLVTFSPTDPQLMTTLITGVLPSDYVPDETSLVVHRGTELLAVSLLGNAPPHLLLKGVDPYYQPKEAYNGPLRAHEVNLPDRTSVDIFDGARHLKTIKSSSGIAMFWFTPRRLILFEFEGTFVYDRTSNSTFRLAPPKVGLGGAYPYKMGSVHGAAIVTTSGSTYSISFEDEVRSH